MSEDFFDIDFPGYSPLEINLKNADDFLKVRETLSRIGVASKKDKVLYQSCHILHKQGRYFITHFKELFALDGKGADSDWGLVVVINSELFFEDIAPLSQIKVLAFKEKDEWSLVAKYNIGKKR